MIMKRRTIILARLASLVLSVALLLAGNQPAYASQPCEPPNIIPQSVCDMDSFYGARPRQGPVGWTIFVLSGEPDFYQDDHTFFGGPNLTIWSNGGTFKAGIYTQVPVTPNAGYRASISWGAPNAPDLFGRQLGIDPTGGTDPNAATVIWGPMHWGEGRILNYPPPDVNIDIKARAVGETMTVFFLTDHPSSSGLPTNPGRQHVYERVVDVPGVGHVCDPSLGGARSGQAPQHRSKLGFDVESHAVVDDVERVLGAQ